MEDFLYEKPFVTLRVASQNDLIETPDQANPDSMGLCKIDLNDATHCISQAILPSTDTTHRFLAFKTSADWEKLGIKKDSWTRVAGVVDTETVPIRHVNRYAVPDIVVQDWIERYRFVVDDLMPHRLRQIHINFNYQEDIAWECDITKAEDAPDACDVYLRGSDGTGWHKQANKVKHPVLKDGSFDFDPQTYFPNLLAIQKDNQNTVTISTVDKIGLSNTQHFSYLFKATANLVQPIWPLADVAVSSVQGFNLFASTLDYQGFAVQSGEDRIIPNDINQQSTDPFTTMTLVTDSKASGFDLTSTLAPSLQGKRFLWNYKIHSGNGTSNDVWDEIIPFTLDVTPPSVSIQAERSVLNPDSSVFFARFKNDTSVDASLRLVRMRLDRIASDGSVVSSTAMPMVHDVIASEFGIGWSGIDKTALSDGTYGVTALALDGAAPDRVTYDAVNDVVAKAELSPTDTALLSAWNKIADPADSWKLKSGLNVGAATATFIIDRTAPLATITSMSALEVSRGKPSSSPSSSSSILYLNQDQTLQLNYSVTKSLLGRDSTPVTLQWLFKNANDTTKVHHAGDSLWIKSANAVVGTWSESGRMQIPEGDYHVRLVARDEAGNSSLTSNATLLRVDRTAPQISELVTKQLVYSDLSLPISATLYVSQSKDLDANKTDLQCYYRVTGPDNSSSTWQLIGTESASKLATNDSPIAVSFAIDKALVGTTKGKRYLEAGCLDGAGNFGERTDLFHVGALSPSIITPDSTNDYGQPIVSIRGLAPVPTGAGLEGVASYRLRWRNATDAIWQTAGLDVGAGKRRTSDSTWVSNEAQPVEGDLGMWDRSTLPTGNYVLELASRACEVCAWVTDSMKVSLGSVLPSTPASIAIAAPATVKAGSATALLSMRVDGSASSNYHGRLYAQDAQGNPLFEVSTSSLAKSPYEGVPASAGSSNGIWFWSSAGEYHLEWLGLPSGKSITVNFKSGKIDNPCLDVAKATLAGCGVVDSVLASSSVNLDSIEAAMGVTSIPEMKTPTGLDKAMVLTQASGHLVFHASSAFRVDVQSLMDQTGSLSLPLWLGKSIVAGLVVSGQSIPTVAFAVNPDLYGLATTWNGLSTTGQYPKGSSVMLYAEAVENAVDGKVLRDSTSIQVTLPDLELVSDEASPLADFYVVHSGETTAMIIGKKTMSYGVHGRDATVNAVVKDASGAVVKTLLKDVPQDAAMLCSAYKLSWDGTDELGHMVTTAGTYSFEITASERNGFQSFGPLVRTFTLSVAPGMTEISDGGMDGNLQSAIKVPEAENDPDNAYNGPQYLLAKLYKPVADYLVKANASGYTLPDSLRNVTLQHQVTGTQLAQGYPAQRFSLAVKRKRETLDLVIAYRVNTWQKSHRWASDVGSSCDWYGLVSSTFYGTSHQSFSTNQRAAIVAINEVRSTDFGFAMNNPSSLEVWAILPKDYEANKTDQQIVNEIDQNEITPVWKTTFNLPAVGDAKPQLNDPSSDGKCSQADADKLDGQQCAYKSDGSTTNGYNPNANLFRSGLDASDAAGYFSDVGKLYGTNCGKTLPRKLSFLLTLTIPNNYWDAGFGYDNLVNRTIRFDQTNKTIFGTGSGFMKAISDAANAGTLPAAYRDDVFFDGSQWYPNMTYGLLTPFEVHNFPFPAASILPGGVNTFLFPDEDLNHMYPSYFYSKFYGTGQQGNFRATILGLPASGTCPAGMNMEAGRCAVTLTTASTVPTEGIPTPLFQHGTVNVMVSLDANPSLFTTNLHEIPYPATASWIQQDAGLLGPICPDITDASWLTFQGSATACSKYYQAGSKVHYYPNDFDETAWNNAMLLDNGTGALRNLRNDPGMVIQANNILTLFPQLNPSLFGTSLTATTVTVPLDPTQYESGSFFLTESQLKQPTNLISGLIPKVSTQVVGVDQSAYTWNINKSRLEFPAVVWKDPALNSSNRIVYRRTLSSGVDANLPTFAAPTSISLEALYTHQVGIKDHFDPSMSLFTFNASKNDWEQNAWIRGVTLSDPQVTALNDSVHTHFIASLGSNTMVPSIDLKRRAIPLAVRPAELLAIEGRVPGAGTKYQLSYVRNGEIQNILSGIMGTDPGTASEPPLLSWFDVNHLEGNTSLMLSWGGDAGQNLNFRKLNLNIGTPQYGGGRSVASIFGDLNVTFPIGSLSERKDVTVRTVSPTEYNFTTFNNAPLRGPVIEVLPSMKFPDSGPFPRVQMQISKTELNGLDPSRVRLYKVDFTNGQFVPLQTILYGYLKADGTPAVPSINSPQDASMCGDAGGSCFPPDGNWSYLLVSGETHTFSNFVALDYQTLPQGAIQFSVSPEVASSQVREVNISGTSDYNLYVDDDSLWANADDATPPVALSVTVGTDGKSRVTLPNRADSWLFLAPKQNGVELASAPLRVHVQLVPSEMVCNVPDSALWLGLDNGYLEFAQSCNQPGMGSLQLRSNGSVVAEIHKTIPDTIRWDGMVGLNKISQGSYTTRYLGVSVTGAEEQQVGPMVRTDLNRPTITSWNVTESSVLLDREFAVNAIVHDDLSGIGKLQLTWTLGSDVLGSVLVSPDSLGNVNTNIIVSRNDLENCNGCQLTMNMHVEDKGHNFTDTSWISDRLWPYPMGLALWYPAQEGSGNVVEEKTGTGHDLDLSMTGPWYSSSGLYFYRAADKATGRGQVDLGSTDEYSMEAWVRPGYPIGTGWKRMLGFTTAAGVVYEVEVLNSDVRLVDGTDTWTATGVLTQPKIWTHLVVSVDAGGVRFYKDGQLVFTGFASLKHRSLTGVFSLGAGDDYTFAGNLSQVRFYRHALTADEVQGIFLNIGTGGSVPKTEITLADGLVAGSGVVRDFSCAAPGSNYWTSPSGSGSLTWHAWVDKADAYKVIVYARSVTAGASAIQVGVQGQSQQTGSFAVENVWRPLSLNGVSLLLASGYSDLTLTIPEGMQIAGIALTNDRQASAGSISWKSTDPIVSSAKMSAQVRYEGYPDPSMIRPRMMLTNTGSTTINGFKVRYYFRGEDPSQVHSSAYYPQDGSLLSVHSETDELGYAEWLFPNEAVSPGQSPFYESGPHFGLYNTGNTPWIATDDPSFVDNAASAYQPAPGIVVLDNDNKVLTGSCFEDETAINTKPMVTISAKDSRNGDASASQLYITLNNVGKRAIKNYDVRYSFYVPGGVTPEFDSYDMQNLTASRVSLGNNKWQIQIHGAISVGPGTGWQNSAQFALHLANWQVGWSASDDPSHQGITSDWSIVTGIEVFDSLGNRIYGDAPVWPTTVASSSSSSVSVSSSSSTQTSSSSSSGSAASSSSTQVSSSSTTLSAHIMAHEEKPGESNSSMVRMYVENTGTQSLSNFEVRYWFTVNSGKILDYQLYNNSQATVSTVAEGGTLYSARFKYSGVTLDPGGTTENGVGVDLFLHYADWSDWTKANDFSHTDIGTGIAEAHYVGLYDGDGNLIWGVEPSIPIVSQNPSIKISKSQDGVILHVLQPALFRVDLVNIVGMPVRYLYSGQLAAGDQLIHVDWTGIDQSTTYLLVRLNGQIVSTQLLSQLGS